MGTIAELVELANTAYKVWRDWRGHNDVSPQELYSKYAAPSYELLKQIHADYLQLYVELEERIALFDPLPETQRWFSQARLARQVDRSELRALDLPPIETPRQRAADINAAALEYLNAIREYFLPSRHAKSHTFAGRLSSIAGSRSDETDRRLVLMLQWGNLSSEDQRAVAAEEVYDATPYPPDRLGRTDHVGCLIEAASGEVSAEIAAQIAKNDTGAAAAVEKLERGDLPRALRGREPNPNVSWQRILGDHVHDQRWSLESSMSEVQRAFIRLRLLTDRA